MRSLRYSVVAGLTLIGLSSLPVYASAPAASLHATIKTKEVSAGYRFTPATKKVKVGTKVTWKDTTDAPHTVTSDTASWKFDKKYDQSSTLSYTFKKAGTFKYHCQYHPGMVGKIIVSK